MRIRMYTTSALAAATSLRFQGSPPKAASSSGEEFCPSVPLAISTCDSSVSEEQ